MRRWHQTKISRNTAGHYEGGPSSSARRHQVSWSSKNGVLSDEDCRAGTTHRRSAMPDRPNQLRSKVDAWNEANRIGTPVEYRRDNGSIMRTATRTRAEVLGGHTAIIWLEGVTGSIDLEWRDPRTASRDPHRASRSSLYWRSPGPASRRGLHLPLRPRTR
jgi:hypothetical protein